MLDPRFLAAIGRRPYAPDDPPLNLSGDLGPRTLRPLSMRPTTRKVGRQ
jgi:hypothetical protein